MKFHCLKNINQIESYGIKMYHILIAAFMEALNLTIHIDLFLILMAKKKLSES